MIERLIQLNVISDMQKLVNALNQIPCDVDLISGRYMIDGKSLLGAFTLSWNTPVKICIHSDNEAYLDNIKQWVVKS